MSVNEAFDNFEKEVLDVLSKKHSPESKKSVKPEEPEFLELEDEEDIEDITGKSMFGNVFGVSSGTGLEHWVTVFDKDHWPEELHQFIYEPDENYVFNPEALEAAVLGIEYNENVNISGPPGCGKTTMVKEIAARTGRPYMRLNGKDGVELSSFIGQMVINENKQTVWEDGLLPIAVKNGFLLAFDEWTKVPAGINMALQALLEEGGKLVLEDKPGEYHEKLVEPHPDFRIVLCDNVKGLGDGIDKYAATNVQDTSTINRIGVSITMDYMSEDDEKLMISNRYGKKLSGSTITRMVQLANKVRASYGNGDVSLTLSPRNLLYWAKWASHIRDIRQSFRWSYFEALSDDQEKEHISQAFYTIFNKQL